MQSTLTVRLPENESQMLDSLCSHSGKTRNAVVREALRAYHLRSALRQSQAQLAPLARASGWLTENDVLNNLSK